VNPSVWDYVRKAFNARPIGMFVPPNWIGLGVFAFLGLLNPGFWIIGLGLEFGYLWTLGTNKRFQRFVGASQQLQLQKQWLTKINERIRQLDREDQEKYYSLEDRCRKILEQQTRLQEQPPGLQAEEEGLSRLLGVYLRLLVTRQAISRIIGEPNGSKDESAGLEERIASLQPKLNEQLSDELKKSLTGQIEILQQRLARRREAKEKLAFLDAELMRIQEQVELVREQAVLSADPGALSRRIDEVTATLGGTAQWITDQQRIYGAVEDLMSDPPPLQISNDE
jgi:DNA repair exonuclease SbcCD ATPase subunit